MRPKPTDGDLTFFGSARDNDHHGAGIVGYSWRSSVDGHLGNGKTLVIPASSLSLGLHTIYFTAQDDEGNWAAEVSVPLLIAEDIYETRLPIIMR